MTDPDEKQPPVPEGWCGTGYLRSLGLLKGFDDEDEDQKQQVTATREERRPK